MYKRQPPLSYAYGDRKIDVCRKLEQYAHRFFAIAPLVIYALTYFLDVYKRQHRATAVAVLP